MMLFQAKESLHVLFSKLSNMKMSIKPGSLLDSAVCMLGISRFYLIPKYLAFYLHDT